MAGTNPQRFLALGGNSAGEGDDTTDVNQEKVCDIFDNVVSGSRDFKSEATIHGRFSESRRD
jgi:hypothetical protein